MVRSLYGETIPRNKVQIKTTYNHFYQKNNHLLIENTTNFLTKIKTNHFSTKNINIFLSKNISM